MVTAMGVSINDLAMWRIESLTHRQRPVAGVPAGVRFRQVGSRRVGSDLRQPVRLRLIHQATGADVEMVMVDGRILMQDRKVLSLDAKAALARGRREAHALADRAGAQVWQHDRAWGQLYRTFEHSGAPPVRGDDA